FEGRDLLVQAPFNENLRITPCPVFADWRMQSNRDKVTDTSAQWEGRLRSQIVRHKEVKVQTDKHVTYLTQPAPQYTENGPEGMVDNIYGNINYRIGGWQGWQEDMVAVVELDNVQNVKIVGVNCLENMRSWIFYPKGLKVEYSLDGETWLPYGEEVETKSVPGDNPQARQGESTTQLFAAMKNVRAKYFKLTVKNYGKLPEWHLSAGEQAWLFVDEIVIL
ncbi:MAG: discoidin domain-containing protein, partial [Bacteroidales bacterium]|nr:discoidin domain-containing protein [Bacteroidales bacterium]